MLKGKSIISNLSKRGIGQGVIIRNNHVIAIEGSDGTDAMLKRARILLKEFSYKNKVELIRKDLDYDIDDLLDFDINGCMKIGIQCSFNNILFSYSIHQGEISV